MFVPGLIERKRDGGALTVPEWLELLAAYGAGAVPDYQMSALLMAGFLRGFTPGETAALLEGMMGQGASLDTTRLDRPAVDKHSTGGVGDKVSLALAPLVACCGAAVPMMSGRGLGHTGGTLDKLESIPGFRTGLSLAEAERQLEQIGCVMIGQTPEIAPVDRRLYALRDVTATVECIPLIAASIMSKKLSEGLSALLLDVKVGSGAFIPDAPRARELARTMIGLGEARGCQVVALLTAMDRPLGRAIGNALEVEEAIAILHGEGPEDVTELTLAEAAEMILMARKEADGADEARRAEVRRELEQAIGSGRAVEKFGQVIEAQGGNRDVIDDPAIMAQAQVVEVYEAPAAGTILQVEPRTLGRAVVRMGGGRETIDSVVDPSVGLVVSGRPGQRVARGEPIASIYAREPAGAAIARAALDSAVRIGAGPAGILPLISERLTASDALPAR
jgi:pyrimidine-nucleoside phosphorylase